VPSLDRQGWRQCFGVLAAPERTADLTQALVAALEMLGWSCGR